MGSAPSGDDVGRLTEPNCQDCNEEKIDVMINDKLATGVPALGSTSQDEIKGNCYVRQVDKRPGVGLQLLENGQKSQVQAQGPIIRWERFLPLRSLKVLLVENDDSTRQVVSALLRNCSYEGQLFGFLSFIFLRL